MNDNTKTYLVAIAFFSVILFVAISGVFGSEEPVRDFLLSILTVSYIVTNLPANKN